MRTMWLFLLLLTVIVFLVGVCEKSIIKVKIKFSENVMEIKEVGVNVRERLNPERKATQETVF